MTAPCARPRLQPRWRFAASPDEARVAALAADLGLPDLVCRLLAARGVDAPAAARSYLRPRLEMLHEVDGMRDGRLTGFPSNAIE